MNDGDFNNFGERLRLLRDEAEELAKNKNTYSTFDVIHSLLCEAIDKYEDLLSI
jgi:hypothetical protein